MWRTILSLAFILAFLGKAQAAGLLIPTEKKLPPLAMVNHDVKIQIDEQIAVTRLEQTFRNHTDRNLEATYIFPVPKGASVRKFSMWVDGKEVPGELVEAEKARKIYTDIVQRTLDPGLLEYMGTDLLKLRVFPVPPKGDQKISITFNSINQSDNGLVEYVYPLKHDGKAISTLEKFTINVALKSQHALTNIYSPSHAITIARPNDKEATIGFEKNQAALDRDFQLYYMPGNKDVGITSLNHRPSPGQPGYFMLLLSPRAELSKSQQVPRDMIFVLDTSGSMAGKRLTQAKAALQYCLKQLTPNDRFGMINFATTVNKYTEQVQTASTDSVQRASKWVADLEVRGGTAINDALKAALEMRTSDPARTFTIVFFTDGRPTIGETKVETILANVQKNNNANTRIFTFGVGDDVNAAMLDALADQSKAISSYVKEAEDIEAKVSSLYTKISHPVLANLKLSVGDAVQFSEIYPPQLPDLFHGSQLVVLGRYQGHGHVALKLTGSVGMEAKDFVYEVNFPENTKEDKPFVEDLWARRKVGYVLDQIRINGEKKELVDEVVSLAKKYGIATPYTSYLMVPDTVPGGPIAGRPVPLGGAMPGGAGGFGGGVPNVRFDVDAKGRPAVLSAPGFAPPAKTSSATTSPSVEYFARELAKKTDGVAKGRLQAEADRLVRDEKSENKALGDRAKEQREQLSTLDAVRRSFQTRQLAQAQEGSAGVNFALQNNALRGQSIMNIQQAGRLANSRNVVDLGGVWIDEKFEPTMKTVAIKAMSNAYFRILEKQPKMREVFALGNYLVWVAPSGMALIVDQGQGQEELRDEEITALFTPAKVQKK